MRIAIDLDNTLLNTSHTCIALFNRLTGIDLAPEDEKHYRYYEFYGWSEEMYEVMYERHGHDIHWDTAPYPNAVEIVKELYSNYELTIMTARPELFSDVTCKSLQHHNIPFHEIRFTRDKYNLCQAMNIDILIDDAPHYAVEFSSKGKSFIIMDQPYNRFVDHNLVKRVTDWHEVRTAVSVMSDTKPPGQRVKEAKS